MGSVVCGSGDSNNSNLSNLGNLSNLIYDHQIGVHMCTTHIFMGTKNAQKSVLLVDI